jgi:hypothetical protein
MYKEYLDIDIWGVMYGFHFDEELEPIKYARVAAVKFDMLVFRI